MIRADLRLRRLPVVLAAALTVVVFAVSDRISAQDPGDWKTFAVWSFTVTRTSRVSSGSQRGTIGLLMTSIGCYETTRAHGAFREEYSKSTDRTRFIPEDGDWNCSLQNLHYTDPDGDVVSAGKGASSQGKFAPDGEVRYSTDPNTKQAMVSVMVSLPTGAVKFRHEYHPLETYKTFDVRVSAKVKEREYQVQIGQFRQSAPFSSKKPLTLRQRQTYPAGEESWVVQRFGENTPELVIEPEHYDGWIPSGRTDERTPANHILVRARLQMLGGGPALVRAKRMFFELVDVSREPGIALNWPPVDQLVKPAPCDLQIDQRINKDLLVTDERDQQKAQTPEGDYLESYVVISAYDWGAFGALRVRAILADGTPVVGRLKDHYSITRVLLPKRKPHSRIADEWRRVAEVPDLADDDDSENEPVGNGYKGDGLSLYYEEYRGFYEDGKHTEGGVRIKDLFVRRETRSLTVKRGIAAFVMASGLRVHADLRRDEMPLDDPKKDEFRVINVNNYSAHLFDQHDGQHGLIIREGELKGPAGQASNLGPPAWVDYVSLDPTLVLHTGDWDDALIVAHELGHAVGLPHHGDLDIGWVDWTKGQRSDGRPVIMETARLIDGTTINPDEYSRPVRVFRGGREIDASKLSASFKRHLWVGREHGQHSGDSECLMCYRVARAIERPRSDLPVRAIVPACPPAQDYFCTSTDGPPPFGQADDHPAVRRKHHGNCTNSIVVNDKFPD